MVYQIAVRLGASSPFNARKATWWKKRVPKAGNGQPLLPHETKLHTCKICAEGLKTDSRAAQAALQLYYIAEVDREFLILLPPPPKSGDYNYAPSQIVS